MIECDVKMRAITTEEIIMASTLRFATEEEFEAWCNEETKAEYVEYEATGVREYWIIDRENQRLVVYYLDEDRRYQPIAPKDGKFRSRVLPGFWVKIDWFWQGPLFDTYEMAKEMGIIG
jgi:hypothetical protein